MKRTFVVSRYMVAVGMLLSAAAVDATVPAAPVATDFAFVETQTFVPGTGELLDDFAPLDVNNDGFMDVFVPVRNGTAPHDAVLIGSANGTLTLTPFVTNYAQGSAVTGHTAAKAHDMNGDGLTDIITQGFDGILLQLNNGDGTFTVKSLVSGACGAAGGGGDLAIGDASGDGIPDVLSCSYTGQDCVLANDGTGNLTVSTSWKHKNYSEWIAVGDFNGDALMDLYNGNRTYQPYWALNGGPGVWFASPTYKSAGNINGGSIGDMNGDGKLDIVQWWRGTQGSVLLGDGAGGMATGAPIPTGDYRQGDIADLDNDGDLDGFVGIANNSIRIFRNDGTGALSTYLSYPMAGSEIYSGTFVDLNNDGFSDLLVARRNLGATVFINQPVIETAVPPVWEVTPPGDLSGDGVVDITDIQCSIIAAKHLFTGTGDAPECTQGDSQRADFNCDGNVNVVDIQIIRILVLSSKLPFAIDANKNTIPDTCDP